MKRGDVYNIGEGKVDCLQVSVSEEHGWLAGDDWNEVGFI